MSSTTSLAASAEADSEIGALSVAEAADRLGVSVSTLRSWERRYGFHAAARTRGGHRRYSHADLVLLHHVRQLTAAGTATGAAITLATAASQADRAAAASSALTDEELRDAYVGAIERLDAPTATASATALLSRHGVTAAWVDTFAPHLRDIGRVWQRTGTAIEREHLAVDVVRTALSTHRSKQAATAREDAALVVLAATEQERHTLPLHALEAALSDQETHLRNFGHLPSRTLHTVIEQLQPVAVVLWARCQHDDDLTQLRAASAASAASATRATVYAAGPGWRRSRLPRSMVHLPDLPTAVHVLARVQTRRWERHPEQSTHRADRKSG